MISIEILTLIALWCSDPNNGLRSQRPCRDEIRSCVHKEQKKILPELETCFK
jgi:hypothetical protein